MQEKKTLKVHKKSGFQPNEKIFAEACSVRYKNLFRAKKMEGGSYRHFNGNRIGF